MARNDGLKFPYMIGDRFRFNLSMYSQLVGQFYCTITDHRNGKTCLVPDGKPWPEIWVPTAALDYCNPDAYTYVCMQPEMVVPDRVVPVPSFSPWDTISRALDRQPAPTGGEVGEVEEIEEGEDIPEEETAEQWANDPRNLNF